MADDNGSDRNLPASQRKLQKAREEGQVARSRDLGHFAAMAGGGALLAAVSPKLTAWMQELVADGLRFDHATSSSPEAILQRLGALTGKMMLVVVPFGIAMIFVALAASMLIGGWNWTLKPLAPKFDKLNP